MGSEKGRTFPTREQGVVPVVGNCYTPCTLACSPHPNPIPTISKTVIGLDHPVPVLPVASSSWEMSKLRLIAGIQGQEQSAWLHHEGI